MAERRRSIMDQIIEDRINQYGDKVFLHFRDQKITYKELDENVNRVANGLLKLEIRPGDKVGIMLPNCPEFLYSHFALLRIGASPVPINVALKGEGLKYIINNSEAKAIFTDSKFIESLKRVRNELPGLKKEIYRAEEPIEGKLPQDVTLYSDLLKSSPEPPEVDIGEPSFGVMYTSGTTGRPKGVTVKKINVEGFLALWSAMGAVPEDTIYTCLPLYHGNALGISVMGALFMGCSLAIGERLSASRFWDEIRKYNAVEFNSLGAMIPILMKQPVRKDDADNPVRVVLSAATPKDVWEAFEKRFNLKIVEWFGMVDSPGYLINTEGKVGAMGRPIGETEFAIFDDKDNELPPGKMGELAFRVPGERPTSYYKMEKETEEAYRGGWFHTGDLAYKDEEGWYYFAGRKKEAMRRRGENISSWEVEQVINSHPKVLESAAVGVPFELGEEDVKAVVVLKEGEGLSPEELLDFCQERMAYFMVPRYVEFKDSIPKTGTHRPIYPPLKKEGVTPNTWDREKAGYKLKR